MKIDQLEIENDQQKIEIDNLRAKLALAEVKQKDDLMGYSEKAKEDTHKEKEDHQEWLRGFKARSDKQHRDDVDAHDNVAATTNKYA